MPGDAALRHDLQLLADAGIVRAPVTTWPLSWPDIARDVIGALPSETRGPDVEAALARIQREARRAAAPGWSGVALRAAAAESPTALRTFEDTPREDAELGLTASWLGDRVAAKLEVSAVANASDDQEARLDGSYVGLTLGNFMISAGAMERWWGPGWEGSLILSSNARPIPGIQIERNYSDPFRWPVLRAFGPWRASIAIGRAEGSDVAVPDVRFLAARVSFKPEPWIELALSRTAQWCGEGRPCGFDTFTDLLLGRDNRSETLTEEEEPGNQMAGYDLRLASPWPTFPAAAYMQWIGEDEAGGLPSKFLGLFGAETWGMLGLGSYRLRFELADTSCAFTRSEPQFDCAYRNSLYPQGYTYRGRAIGHAMDNDGRSYSVSGLWVRPDGDSLSVLVRRFDLNRGGGTPDVSHTVAAMPVELTNVELQYNRDFSWGRLLVGAGYDDYKDAWRGSNARGFIEWRQRL
jgi:hypothetical protein